MGTKLKRSEMNWQKCVCHYRNYSMRESPNKGSFSLRKIHMALYERSVIFMKRKITIDPTIWRTLTVKQKFWAVIGKILYKIGYLKD